MAKTLTPKQRKFVKAKAQGKTGVEAAMIAYDTKDYATAASISAENLRKPQIANALEDAFARAGITADAIVQPIAEGLQATRTVIVRDKGAARRIPGESDEAYEERQTDASFIDERPDHGTRLRAAGLAAQLLGLNKQPKDDTPPIPAGISFIQNNTYIQGQ